MSHSVVLVVLPDTKVAERGLDGALTDALEPFDENRETPQYIKLTKAQAIEKKRAELIRYRDEGPYADYIKDPAAYAESHTNIPNHVEYLRTGFPEKLTHLDDEDWLYQQAIEWEEENLDEDGNITSTYNPQSKWDWWTIGGRWAASMLNAEIVDHHEAKVVSEKWTEPAWDEYGGGDDIVQKRNLTSCRTPFAFLDAAGEWHQRGRMGWWGMVSDEQEPDTWEAQFKDLLAKVDDDHWLVVVDVHI